MCVGSWVATANRSLALASYAAVVGVDDKNDQATLAGRPDTCFVEQSFDYQDFDPWTSRSD